MKNLDFRSKHSRRSVKSRPLGVFAALNTPTIRSVSLPVQITLRQIARYSTNTTKPAIYVTTLYLNIQVNLRQVLRLL